MRAVLCLLVCLVAAPVVAQVGDVETTALGVDWRQGTVTTAATVIPARELQSYLVFRLDLPTASYEDTTNRVGMMAYVYDVEAAVWRFYSGAGWTGGRFIRQDGTVNPPPMLFLDQDELRGRTVRVELEVPQRMRVGLTQIVRRDP
jgi:hypothetical protein